MEASSSMPPLIKLRGHSASILSCQAAPPIVASASQDGTVCLFDLRNQEVVHRYQCFDGKAVASIFFSPGGMEKLYAAAGSIVHCLDIRSGPMLREMLKYTFNSEEINQIVLNKKGNFLAAADDSGETKIVDIKSSKLHKTLRGVHTNICSTVQFHPQKPWEVITGGLDSKIVKWDFSSGRPQKIIDFGEMEAGDSSSSTQLCNPPFVHALATPEDKGTSGEVGKLLAVARGDGVVSVCDISSETRQASKLRNSAMEKKTQAQMLTLEWNVSERSPALYESADNGHKAAVSCITFARFGNVASMVMSGGNDKFIKLWSSKEKENEESIPHWANNGHLKLNLCHKKKINWLSTTDSASENLFVADTSKVLSVYTIA